MYVSVLHTMIAELIFSITPVISTVTSMTYWHFNLLVYIHK